MVTLPPKAIRFLLEAAFEPRLVRDDISGANLALVRGWANGRPKSTLGLRTKEAIPSDISTIFASVVEIILRDPDRAERILEWDGNDIAFMTSIRLDLQAELFPNQAVGG